MDRYPVFKATFSEDSTYDRLRLSLTSTINVKKFRDEVILRDCYGNNWPVRVEVIGSGMFFLDGWRSFSKHNYLEDGDVITFRNGETRIFNVRIFGSDGSEKKGIGRRILIGTSKESPGVGKNEKYEFKPSNRSKCYLRRGKEVNVYAHALSKTRKNVDPFGRKLFKYHPDQKPNNPFFVTWFREERKSALLVPMKIVTQYKLNLPPNIILKDSEERKWNANLGTWKDGRQRYGGGGWGELCRVNLIKPEDILICEFLRSEKKGLHTIQVHVFQPRRSG